MAIIIDHTGLPVYTAVMVAMQPREDFVREIIEGVPVTCTLLSLMKRNTADSFALFSDVKLAIDLLFPPSASIESPNAYRLFLYKESTWRNYILRGNGVEVMFYPHMATAYGDTTVLTLVNHDAKEEPPMLQSLLELHLTDNEYQSYFYEGADARYILTAEIE